MLITLQTDGIYPRHSELQSIENKIKCIFQLRVQLKNACLIIYWIRFTVNDRNVYNWITKMPLSSQLFDTRYRLLFIRAIASPFIIQNIYLLIEKAQNETSTLTFIVSNCFLMAGFINNSTFTISILKHNRFHKIVLLMQVNSKLKKICNSVLFISSG